jgi:hypothetical protein
MNFRKCDKLEILKNSRFLIDLLSNYFFILEKRAEQMKHLLNLFDQPFTKVQK